ncbi:uncharacterized protein AC631_02140 [Debaryomyces fabryi]|uniref:Uncharacterized protein n=1 Tax=Debaryomyces fabryi TaxID=58627 RepID=A0A0V1Q0W6_9ASCO|nr:uncharacterized protein AC631_02140 [Debaryomyces fabryi]KSA02066.1 hypothetical protein AC631_02140 [Debaryomyces fabryi]CUM51072.1 unnamed protein product [Debaryomyces fabryi]
MNSINRNPKPISRKPSSFRPSGLNITPTTNKLGRFSSKSDLLARFQDTENNNEEDDIFGGDAFNDLPIEDEFKTLKINPNELETLRLKNDHATINNNNIKNRIHQFREDDTDDMGFEDDDFSRGNLHLNYRTTLNEPDDDELKLSPGTISTSSPKPRMRSKSLSEYSEDTNDTDVTSQFNDDDFDNINDVDDIFGNEESGIYSSGGNGNTSKANRHLLMKQQKLQNDAEIEERELFKKYKRLTNEETNTLKLKDFTVYGHNPIDTDALENEKTVDYEYTKDDFENFEDGFDTDVPIKLDVDKLKQYSRGDKSVRMKNSMPNFNNKNKLSKAKKYKSSMDLVNEFETQHPVFNNNNKIIRKLDRIPSFYTKNDAMKSNNSKLNQDIELEKQQLLNKYMEITEKQNRLNNRHRKKNLSMKNPNGKNKRIGLVRYLNDNPIPQPNNNSKMKYNPINKKWEGNDIELVKFENLNVPKPLLISFNDFKNNMKDKKIQGNMVYDPDQLKWINLNKDEDNIFQGLSDLPDLQIDKRSVSNSPTKNIGRGVSAFTQRTGSTNSIASSNTNGNEFEIPPKLIEKFHKEEMKLLKKINYWFQQQNYDLINSDFNHNYFWEIRKMVIDNED